MSTPLVILAHEYANVMYYVFYIFIVYVSASHCFVIRYVWTWPESRRHRTRFYSITLWILSILLWFYWLILLTAPTADHLYVNGTFFGIVAPFLFFLGIVAVLIEPHPLDSETFEYISKRYNYPIEELKRRLAPYAIRRFPVNHFEANLTMKIPASDARILVDQYLDERLATFDRVRLYELDAQFLADRDAYAQLWRGSMKPFTDHVCDYEKIRQIKYENAL